MSPGASATCCFNASSRSLLRLAAAAGRDIPYPLLRATAGVPEARLRASLRRAVEEGVLVMEPPGAGFRFRHALLAEAIYATILPGEQRVAEAEAGPRRLRDEDALLDRSPQ